MRWFVEVSRVGENSSDEKYCVEAKQWQAALQEARRLRGDSGPLSKFSIELLDDGYRAVDPKLKLRFLVAKAPQDAPLSTEAGARPDPAHRNGTTVIAPSVAPVARSVPAPPVAPVGSVPAPPAAPVGSVSAPPVAPVGSVSAPPVALVGSVSAPKLSPSVSPKAQPFAVPSNPALAPTVQMPVQSAPAPADAPRSSAVPAFAAHAEPYAGVPSSALSPNALPSAAPAAAKDKSGSVIPPRREGSVRPPSVKPAAGAGASAIAIPAAPAVPKDLSVPAQNLTQPSPAMDMPAPASVLRKRQEEPSDESPITYREIAYVVEPGATRGSVEALLWASFRDISRELAQRPGQKFVQLAVFDHRFEKRPERPPLGTLAWKDWRGNPVLSFPFFDGTPPARASVPAPSIKPAPVLSVGGSAPPRPTGSERAPAPPLEGAPVALRPVTTADALPPAQGTPAQGTPAQGTPAQAAAVLAPPPPPNNPSDPSAAIPLTREKAPSQPSVARASKPRVAALKRRAGEDLIGELFETMHDLNFMRGIDDGAEFVLAAVESVVPCDGVLIQVFDINKREFVVVRAKGPGAMPALLHRTPDSDPFIQGVMRRAGSVAITDVGRESRLLGARWTALGVEPRRALCGPVRLGGRYLGLVELANPLGDAPFHQTEQNAIDYVCEQFAQFLANRPIVLDADVILRR